MTAAGFLLALVRTALVAVPVVVAAHLVRVRLSSSRGAPGVALELALGLSWLLIIGELLGLVGGLRLGWLVAAMWVSAVIVVAGLRSRQPAEATQRPAGAGVGPAAGRTGTWVAIVVVWLAVGQWALSTANALGGGMLSFDVLWYHMPFAAVFARTGSVTGITFTQADPFVAYYPANSELFHAFGIVAFGNDFLSPFLNLGWMAIDLLGAWCVGRRWRVEWLTLASGALLLALPVLGTTQPGEAFNDIVGLAALSVALALILAPSRGGLEVLAAGLALGIAVGTKYTFLVPAFALVIGVIVTSPRGQRRRNASALVGGLVATGGWWYLRAAVHTGNPLGLRQTLGPLHLSGPTSPLANASQQTVFSEIRHLSLWGTRFAPGLAHAFGPFWPLLLLGCVAAVLGALATRSEPVLGAFAVATVLAAISYLFLPTGATGIEHSTTLFQVNLRYLAPALALALLLAPIIVAIRIPRLLKPLMITVAAIAVVAQLERGMLRTQPGRHAAFLIGIAALLALGVWSRPRLSRARPAPRLLTALVLLLLVIGAGDLAQRHYFHKRYLVGATSQDGIGVIYRWAQTVAHTRIALYGTVEQYPLYGATDTNTVDYLGQPLPHGGYEPISSCARWQMTLAAGDYHYLVLTPAPTAAIPLQWTRQDPNLKLLLHPGAADWVFQITHTRQHPTCSTTA